jgi:response regulator of citrate/malate metabolism
MALTYSRITLPPLWTVADAKVHLRLTGSDSDADVLQKLEAAQEAVLAKLGPAADAAWTAVTAPRVVRHAVLILLDAFMERRGGDEATDQLRKAYETVDVLLSAYRDVSLA